MNASSFSRPGRCARCQRPVARCLCSLIPSLQATCPLLILQHHSEARHALNTGRLAYLGVQGAQLWVGEQFEDLEARLAQAQRPVLLFPGPQAQVARALAPQHRPDLIVVPDGTWRKARLILHRNPILQRLPHWVLPQGDVSRYRLRKAPDPQAVSTLEAIVRLMQLMEPERDFSALLRPFEHLIEEQIQAMGLDTYERNYPTSR
ncbi:DTW domain-containing protein [Alcaligenes ammonioxydans]|uniref:tRNA-uridine aminocarboxypropyltransferase n=1 Tax=Alcaligenes TaxID=507 RepID=UPI001F05D879|nr:DTW domain-containing protein [Alcaligenes ammonioxydans]MCH1878598.1 DTW domain-containing protein [Alcaligenes ammonioxydans]